MHSRLSAKCRLIYSTNEFIKLNVSFVLNATSEKWAFAVATRQVNRIFEQVLNRPTYQLLCSDVVLTEEAKVQFYEKYYARSIFEEIENLFSI